MSIVGWILSGIVALARIVLLIYMFNAEVYSKDATYCDTELTCERYIGLSPLRKNVLTATCVLCAFWAVDWLTSNFSSRAVDSVDASDEEATKWATRMKRMIMVLRFIIDAAITALLIFMFPQKRVDNDMPCVSFFAEEEIATAAIMFGLSIGIMLFVIVLNCIFILVGLKSHPGMFVGSLSGALLFASIYVGVVGVNLPKVELMVAFTYNVGFVIANAAISVARNIKIQNNDDDNEVKTSTSPKDPSSTDTEF